MPDPLEVPDPLELPEPVSPPERFGVIVPECLGGMLLPLDVPQSFIAWLVPWLPVALELVPELGVLDAVLPGPQSVRWPFMPEAAPGLIVLGLVLVCAIAAVPSVSATIDAAVKRTRFISFPPHSLALVLPGGKRRWDVLSFKPTARGGCSGLA